MKDIKITTKEAIIFEILLIENRDNKKLQTKTNCSYIESVSLLNKLRKKLNR